MLFMYTIKGTKGEDMMNKNISIIGVPMDLGQARRGVDMGPSAIRYAGVIERLEKLQYDICDLGDIAISPPDREHKKQNSKLRNLRQVTEANDKLYTMLDEEMKKNRCPLISDGHQSIASCSLAGISKHYNPFGLIWHDAQRD